MLEKYEQVQKFIDLCEYSSFPYREELLRGIKAGEYLLESYSVSQIPTGDLADTYKIKAQIAGINNSFHAQRLVRDTLILVEELKKVPDEKVNFWSFSIDRSSQFTAFEGVSSRKVLGCLFTVAKTKVSELEWKKLWNE